VGEAAMFDQLIV